MIKMNLPTRRWFTSPPIIPIRFTGRPNTAYPPTYLPPSPGEQFGNSFVNGLGFSTGVATTYAIFSNIDWDDDDDWNHHHDGDWDNHGGYNRNGDNNININVENFNKISGQRLTDANRTGSTTRPIGKVSLPDKPAQHAFPLHQHGHGA